MKKLIVFLLFPTLVNADAGAAKQYLINEPATLLDVGMLRLASLANEFEQRVGLHWTDGDEMKLFRAEVGSHYDEEAGMIYVSIYAMNDEPTEAQMAEGCRNAMTQMNIWLVKSLPGLFLHRGYEDPSVPPLFSKGLRDMFELRCYFSSSHDSSQGRFWASRKVSPDGGGEMQIGQWDTIN